MISIKEQNNVFCDAFVGYTDNILFASLWGRNTSLQQLLARLELTSGQESLDTLSFDMLTQKDVKHTCFYLGNKKKLHKVSARIPGTIYGKDLSHVFLYDKSTIAIDHANLSATILYLSNQELDDSTVWLLLKDISPMPLMEHWRDIVLPLCTEQGYINQIQGFGGVSALKIQLCADDFEMLISTLIKNKQLLRR